MKKLEYSFALLLVAALAVSPGCNRNKSTEENSASRSLLVFCWAGLRPPMAELAERFGREHNVTVQMDYAGSQLSCPRSSWASKVTSTCPATSYMSISPRSKA